MIKKVKVHLGYWLAHSCHKIAHHPVRHLYACHLVGAYLIRNVMSRMTIPKFSIVMCEDPEWFDISYFISIGIIKEKKECLVFCKAEKSEEENATKSREGDSDPREAAEEKISKERPLPNEVKPKIPKAGTHSAEERPEGTKEKLQRIIVFMMQEFSKANERKQEFLEL